MKPFLKYAGGKHRLIDKITAVTPNGKRLVEPFVGGGSVFMGTNYNSYLLCDANKDLIDLYNTIKTDGDFFIKGASILFSGRFNTKEAYYRLRAHFNNSTDTFDRSLIFLYLNRHGFNGLCRYNKKGVYNVPFGSYTFPYFPEKELRAFQSKAQKAEFIHCDFAETYKRLEEGDVVYCDPPYVSYRSGFTNYTAGGFSLAQQRLLVMLAKHHATLGIPSVISNAFNPWTQKYYGGYIVSTFPVKRYISAKTKGRVDALELLALFS